MKFFKAKRILCAMLSLLMVMSFLPMQSLIGASATENPYSDGITDYVTDSTDDYTIDSAEQLAGLAGLTNNGGSGLAGGIAGYVPDSGTTSGSGTNIDNCYNESGSQSGYESGGIAGTGSGTNIGNSTESGGIAGTGNGTNIGNSTESENIVVTYTYDETTNTYSVCDEQGLNAWNVAAQNDPTTNLVITADITLTLAEGATSNWTPVGNDTTPYTGTIDGAGYTITGLTIDSSTDYTGFIGHLGELGYIKNLTLKDVSITSTGKYTGGLVGCIYKVNSISNAPVIEFCSVEGGTISSSTYGVAGIVGYALGNIKVIACSNTANITGSSSIAGIVGSFSYFGGLAYGCYNAGKITKNGSSSSWSCGGIVGYAQYGKIHGCYNTGETNEWYAIVGDNRSSGTYYNNSNYWSSSHSYANGTYCQYEYFNDGATKITSASQWADAATVMNQTLSSLGYTYQYIVNTNEDTKGTEPLLICINHPQWEDGVCQNCGLECIHKTVVPATCTDKAYCSDCGVIQSDVNPDNHTGGYCYVDNQTNIHDKKWDCCGAYVSSESHNFICTEENGTMSKKCEQCGQSMTMDFTLSETSLTYDGTVKTPVVYITDDVQYIFVEGVDYTVEYPESKNVGTYEGTVTFIGNHRGTKTFSYSIVAAPVSSCDVSIESSLTYNGKVQTPVVSVKGVDGTVLAEGTDYTVKYADSKNVGTYNAVVTMMGSYTGEKTVSYEIVPMSISDCTVTLSRTEYTYNGKEKKPTVSVKNSAGTTLTNGKHYTVTYADGRIKVGTYKVTVKMIDSNYTGTKTLTFKINPIDISTCTVTLSKTSYTYNGKVQTPSVTVKNASGTTLTKDTHYTVSYESGRKNAGTYDVTITMKGHYGGTKTLSYKIKPIDISKCTVKLSNTSYTYNGKAKTPSVTVKNETGTTLTKDTHYTVSYPSDRKNAGTYKVTVTMKGNYTGTKTLSFKIKPIEIDTCTVKLSSTSYTYNGKVKTPSVTVKNAGGTTLTKDTHYTVSYESGRKNVGTYDVTVTMIGNYTGTATLSFKIKPANISTCTVSLSKTSYTYNSKTITPGVTVKNSGGTALTKDTHYTVSYASGRKNVGTYDVTVTMKGNYTGTKTLSFKIKPIEIDTCTVKLSSTSYTYNGKVKTPSVTVKNSGGTTLTKDTHYTVSYASGRTNAGTYKVTVTMKGNYTGTKTLSFKIKPIDVSTCTLKLSKTSYTYDGKAKSPYVTAKSASGATLTEDTHFTYSYATSRKAIGKHKVTVTMKGNYTGTADLYFTIKPPYTTINKLVAGTKLIKAVINTESKVVSGYQISYSISSDFTDSTTKTVAISKDELESIDTLTVKLEGLTSGKTYYVKVRTYKTVDDVKYYSGWSSHKYIKAK